MNNSTQITPVPNKEPSVNNSINVIVPIVTFILFVLLLCHTLVKYGLHRFFDKNSIPIDGNEIKNVLLPIIGVVLCIILIISILYYFSSSSIMNYSFNIRNISALYTIQDFIYTFFFILAIIIIVVLPLIIKLYTPESPEYNIYAGSIVSFIACIMFVYFVVTDLKSDGINGISKISSFIEKYITYIASFIFILAILICILLAVFYNKIQLWVIPFVCIISVFVFFTILTFPQLTRDMDKNMEWFPKSILEQIVYSIVFLPLRLLYYYPYIFINYLIPTIYSLFFSPSIFIYTLTFILGLMIMKYIFPYFSLDLNHKVYIFWCILYFMMLMTNSFIKTKTKFFTMRQGFLFVCLFLVFIASSFIVQRSDSIPEYLKLYLNLFIILTCLVASFLFFYMVNIDYGKEFTDCNVFKPLINQSVSSDEKLQGAIPILKRVLFAYLGIGISFYLLIFLVNKFSPIHQGTLSYIFSIIFIILLSMIIISLLKKIINKLKGFDKQPSPFVNFILSLFSLIFELLFYIPCKLHDIVSYTTQTTKITKTTVIFIILDIVFILLYIYGDYIRKHLYLNGMVIPSLGAVIIPENTLSYVFPNVQIPNVNLKFPISLKEYDMDVSNIVATSTDKSMNDTDNTIYNYTISFWFYIDTNNPNTSMAYSKYTPIFNYGDTPLICYNYITQSFIVASKSDNTAYPKLSRDELNDEFEKYTNSNLKIIYETKNIQLQKWNHFVVIYNSSYIDIFMNGGLVKANAYLSPVSSDMYKSDIPQIINLVAGHSNGIRGRICNIIYYNKKIGLYDVTRLYDSVKDNNPPIFYPSLL